MKTPYALTVPLAAALAVVALALAGCGNSAAQKTAAEDADIKMQVEQVCREVATELKGLEMPTTQAAAVKTQTESAQIFKNATGKLNELGSNVELPDSYKSWLGVYEKLSGLNQQAANVFKSNGITSDQAIKAGEEWQAQATKANDLAGKAGLTNCAVGQPKG